MDYTEAFLPELLIWLSSIAVLALLLAVSFRLNWMQLYKRGILNVWLFSVFALAIVWMIRAGIDDGYNVHLLGTMLFALMFGWRLGVIGISLVGVLICAWGNILLQNLPLTILVNAFFAVTLCYLIFLIIEHFLPHNLYIYLYLSAFFGAAISYCITGTLAAAMLWLFGLESWSSLANEYLPFLYLMSFAESFLTCGLLTLLVVYRPEWVFSFRDERYLEGK